MGSGEEADKEAKTNFSKANLGRKHTEEHRQKNSNAKKGNKFRSNAGNRKDIY